MAHYSDELEPTMMDRNADRLLATGDFSDFTIICGGISFKVHQAVICYASAYFKKACLGAFQESGTKCLTLPEHDPAVLAYVLAHIYTNSFPASENPRPFDAALVTDLATRVVRSPLQRFLLTYSLPNFNNGKGVSLLVLAKIYLAADFFLLTRLKRFCLGLMINKLHDLRTKDMEAFAEAARFVYDQDLPEDVRRDFGCALHLEHQNILRGITATGEECVRKMIVGYPELAFNAMARCQSLHRYRNNWIQGCDCTAASGRCPNGDSHLCGGVCANIDPTTIVCQACVVGD